jgi:hypothetical protein
MCGRFVQRYTWADIQDLYDLPDGPARNLQAHYNVAPTDPINVVRTTAEGARELVSMRWGLVLWWWNKPLKQVPASFNARAETVANKPMTSPSGPIISAPKWDHATQGASNRAGAIAAEIERRKNPLARMGLGPLHREPASLCHRNALDLDPLVLEVHEHVALGPVERER